MATDGTIRLPEVPAASVSTPPANKVYLFVDSADNSLKTKDDLGIVRSSLATDKYPIMGSIATISAATLKQAVYGVGTQDPTMAFAGQVVAISISLSAARTAGSCRCRVRLNGVGDTGVGQFALIDGTTTNFAYQLLTTPIVFVPGDRIGIETAPTGFAPTGAAGTMTLWVVET